MDEKKKPKGPPVKFLCDRCADTLRQNGTRLYELTGVESGFCELGRYRHGNPVMGRQYELSTPQAREAAYRRRVRERRGPEVRARGGGERRRAERGEPA